MNTTLLSNQGIARSAVPKLGFARRLQNLLLRQGFIRPTHLAAAAAIALGAQAAHAAVGGAGKALPEEQVLESAGKAQLGHCAARDALV